MPEIGSSVRLLIDVWDDGADHHPPGYIARENEIVIVRGVSKTGGSDHSAGWPIQVSHAEVTDNYFRVARHEIEIVPVPSSDSPATFEGERVSFGTDTTRALDSAAESDIQCLPQVFIVHGRRLTGSYRKKLRGWPGKVHTVICEECKRKIALAESTKQSVDEARASGATVRIMCDNCYERLGVGGAEVVTDAQAQELETISKRLEKRNTN